MTTVQLTATTAQLTLGPSQLTGRYCAAHLITAPLPRIVEQAPMTSCRADATIADLLPITKQLSLMTEELAFRTRRPVWKLDAHYGNWTADMAVGQRNMTDLTACMTAANRARGLGGWAKVVHGQFSTGT